MKERVVRISVHNAEPPTDANRVSPPQTIRMRDYERVDGPFMFLVERGTPGELVVLYDWGKGETSWLRSSAIMGEPVVAPADGSGAWYLMVEATFWGGKGTPVFTIGEEGK